LPRSFRCTHCRLDVPTDAPGTRHRNHCPSCLWSRHLDVRPGDRSARCAAAMEPIAVSVRDDGEWQLVHRCRGCDAIRLNRVAGDDNPHSLMKLATRPLERPALPAHVVHRELGHVV
jgi:RNHCP domain-containing protein